MEDVAIECHEQDWCAELRNIERERVDEIMADKRFREKKDSGLEVDFMTEMCLDEFRAFVKRCPTIAIEQIPTKIISRELDSRKAKLEGEICG